MSTLFPFDDAKARSNLAKHGVTFEEAKQVFADGGAAEFFDEGHSGDEERFVRIGVSGEGRVIVVVYADLSDEEHEVYRIISARRATRRERLVRFPDR